MREMECGGRECERENYGSTIRKGGKKSVGVFEREMNTRKVGELQLGTRGGGQI